MVICAALEIAHENDPKFNLVICGYRHSDCFETLYRLNPDLSRAARKENRITEGFLVTGNRFMDREDAYKHAVDCGQISAQARYDKAARRESGLFSEDLY